MIRAEDLVGDEWAEWYRPTPRERESAKIWDVFLAFGVPFEPEPDT